MKRPPGLWCLLIIASFWLCIQDVDSLRATALILGKSPSTTTTTEAPQELDNEETATEAAEETQNVTKPILTGNPQIDYVWDPNLPRELNGYNLSEYPFYDRVPEDINFKCDGLHDGFYASVPHKCQVYHHCLFGIRYDFLCANYTAFDQKTFICHFVSEVDCVNSKKFWHRNDALYKAAETTTVKPVVVYTPPPTPPLTSVPIEPILSRRPGATAPGRGFRHRVPPKRYDYYDDEYDDAEYEERRYPKRPHYRRPVYEDDYEEYEDEYPKRRPSRRRPDRRGQTRRNKEDRRRYEDDDYELRDSEASRDDEEVRRPNRNRRPSKRRPVEDEDYDRRYDRPPKRNRRPMDDEEYDDVPPPPRRNRKKNRNRDSDDKDEDRPKKKEDRLRSEGRNNRNDDRNRNEERRSEDRNRNDDRKNEERKSKGETKVKVDLNTEEPPLTKAPLSLYERKRPPKIRPPIPLSEQNKFSPKTTTLAPDEEYYDEYEDEEIPEEEIKETKRKTDRRPPKRTYGKQRSEEEEPKRTTTTTTTKRPQKDKRLGSGSRRRPVIEEYEDYEESSKSEETAKEIKEKQEPTVKVVKRPFLPSRGGNPYAARGLLPVGLKSDEPKIKDNSKQIQDVKLDQKEDLKVDIRQNFKADIKQEFKTDLKQDLKPDFKQDLKQELKEFETQKPQLKRIKEDDFKPITNRPVSRINIVKITTTTTTTTTEKPPEKNPLDLDENEYDVTLNDALNPTIPNLPIRNFPTGFSQNDYNYNAVQRSRYVADPTLNQASSDYVYRIEPLQSTRYVPVYQPYRQTSRQQQQAFYAGY